MGSATACSFAAGRIGSYTSGLIIRSGRESLLNSAELPIWECAPDCFETVLQICVFSFHTVSDASYSGQFVAEEEDQCHVGDS